MMQPLVTVPAEVLTLDSSKNSGLWGSVFGLWPHCKFPLWSSASTAAAAPPAPAPSARKSWKHHQNPLSSASQTAMVPGKHAREARSLQRAPPLVTSRTSPHARLGSAKMDRHHHAIGVAGVRPRPPIAALFLLPQHISTG